MSGAMGRMIRQLGASPTEDEIQAIGDIVVREGLTREEIARGVNSALADPAGFFPRPGKFLAWARPRKPDVDSSRDASSMFDKIRLNTGCRLGHVDPVSGTQWDEEKVHALLGDAALSAFRAVGGNRTFKEMTVESETWVRKEFVAAYKDTSPETLLLPSQPNGKFLRSAKYTSNQDAEISALIDTGKRLDHRESVPNPR